MILQHVFEQLLAGELSQFKIAETPAERLTDAQIRQLVLPISLGLTELYKRFPLKEGRFFIELQPNQVEYRLHSRYAASNTDSNEAVKYILDASPNQFHDDLLKVERVLTLLGFELPLNKLDNEYSLFTPTTTRLRVPEKIVNQDADLPDVLKTEMIEVFYRANHPTIDMESSSFDPFELELELPDAFLEALLLFVAMRFHAPMGAGQLEGYSSNPYFARFEAACERLKLLNLAIDQDASNGKLRARGFP